MKENKPEHLETLQKIGGILLAIVAIFGAALPIAGFSFSLGYLSVFGMDADVFPRSIGDLWQYSYLMSLKWLAPIIKAFGGITVLIILMLLAIISLCFILAILRKAGKLPLSEEKYKALFGKVDLIFETIQIFYDEFRGFLHATLAGTTILLFFMLLLADPFRQGKEIAQKILYYYNESGCASENWSSCVEYSNPNNPLARSYSGLLVSASSTHVAIFDSKKISIIPRNPDYVLTKTYKATDKQAEVTGSMDKK